MILHTSRGRSVVDYTCVPYEQFEYISDFSVGQQAKEMNLYHGQFLMTMEI
jgi:hypothetical protein